MGDLSREVVSVVVATGATRRPFLRQLLRCWDSQTLELSRRELVVVDDGDDGVGASLCDGRASVRHVELATATMLGDKLNAGVALARGGVIAKWDDDDWYAPRYLQVALAALAARPAGRGFVLWGEYLILLAATGALHTSGPDHKAGNTLTFDRAQWDSAPFRSLPSRVDSAFIEDHPDFAAVDDPGAVMAVRHGANTWNEHHGIEVDPYIAGTLERWPQPLADVVGTEAAGFYERLRRDAAAG